MKIGYFISEIGMSGGIKVILQHVKILKEIGHDTILISRSVSSILNDIAAGIFSRLTPQGGLTQRV